MYFYGMVVVLLVFIGTYTAQEYSSCMYIVFTVYFKRWRVVIHIETSNHKDLNQQ